MVSTVNGLNVKAINIFAGFLIIGDNCVVFENFTASIGDLMVSNWVYWRRVSGASKRIFATIKLKNDAVKFSNTIQLSPNHKPGILHNYIRIRITMYIPFRVVGPFRSKKTKLQLHTLNIIFFPLFNIFCIYYGYSSFYDDLWHCDHFSDDLWHCDHIYGWYFGKTQGVNLLWLLRLINYWFFAEHFSWFSCFCT